MKWTLRRVKTQQSGSQVKTEGVPGPREMLIEEERCRLQYDPERAMWK